jgi:hypothetical protein
MKILKEQNSKEHLNIEESLITKMTNEKYFYSNQQIYERKWKIFIVNCCLFLILTMAVDAPQQMQYILENKHKYTTLKYLLFFIIVNFISCFTRRIINNFRKAYSNKTALMIIYSCLIIGQFFFYYGLSKDSYMITIIGRFFLALSKDPLSIIIISQISKVFLHHYGNIPLSIINSMSVIGNILNCFILPYYLENYPIQYSSYIYLIMLLFGILFIIILYFIEFNLEINALNESFTRAELSKKRSSFLNRKSSEISEGSLNNNYKFFDFSSFIEEFRYFTKEFYLITISGSLSFLQLFNYTFILNDYYTVNYNFSLQTSGNIIACFFILCLIQMPLFLYLSKLLKNKLNFLILGNVCAIFLSLFSLIEIDFYYLNILLHSIEFSIFVGIITECFPYIVDQEHYSYAFEFNRIILYFAVGSGALICGVVVTILPWLKFIFPFYFFIIVNLVSIKLLLKVKENCENL